MKENNIVDEDLICEIEIGPDQFNQFVNGHILEKDFPINLKRNCIFRGLSKDWYNLIPNALRKEENGESVLCKYLHDAMSKHYHSSFLNEIKCDKKDLTLELQYKREFYILFKFLDKTDKSGLNVLVDRTVRKLLHSNINPKFKGYWPQSQYYEVMALAQHSGLPTCALDWSYDYKVPLYFAVKDVLDTNKLTDGILWAFNYKHLEKESEFVMRTGIEEEEKSQLRFYRPQYCYNQNLKPQKGLFTFLINDENTFNPNEIKPLDEFVCEMIKENGVKKDNSEIEIDLHGIENFTLKNDEKIFYKFIIKKECKADILEYLYSDGYSEEYLFPGYGSVAEAMKNWATLQNIKNNRKC